MRIKAYANYGKGNWIGKEQGVFLCTNQGDSQ